MVAVAQKTNVAARKRGPRCVPSQTHNGVFRTHQSENRLAAVQPLTVGAGTNRVQFSYDYRGRRVRKVVLEWDGSAWGNGGTNLFLYDGWNLIGEFSGSETNWYAWGLDLSGTLQGAGGVGGLLAVTQVTSSETNTYFPCMDGNGNVCQYVDASGTNIVAAREYSPFGQTIALTGSQKDDFNFWFSTRYLDQETGLYAYPMRYYSPELGRWLSRDPGGEEFGENLYVFLENNGLNHVDPLGLYRFDRDHGCSAAQVRAIKDAFNQIKEKLRGLNANDYGRCLDCIYREIPARWGRKGSRLLRELKQSSSLRPNSGTPIIRCRGRRVIRRIIGYTIVPEGETPQEDDIRRFINGAEVTLRPVWGERAVGGEVNMRTPSYITLRPDGFTMGGGIRCTLLHEMVHSVGREENELATTLNQVFCLGRGWGCSAYGISESTRWGPSR